MFTTAADFRVLGYKYSPTEKVNANLFDRLIEA